MRVRSLEYHEKNRIACRQRYHDKYKHNPNHRVNAYRYTIKKRYGLSEEDFNKLFGDQDRKCLICECILYNPFKKEQGDRPQVDHCHKTEKVRGLLCQMCNTGLGSFNDNKELLLKAVKYLEASDRHGDGLPQTERSDEGSLSGGQRC